MLNKNPNDIEKNAYDLLKKKYAENCIDYNHNDKIFSSIISKTSKIGNVELATYDVTPDKLEEAVHYYLTDNSARFLYIQDIRTIAELQNGTIPILKLRVTIAVS